ncbi:FAD-dependent oxidoreductase [Streptomyces sp. TRM76323]|uniref:FAD-dependent oxidoreductase n=1 Tax=Streptomyces tamarix TaxID=3078565 RepID=A0ABU3QK25_9ACTN|nr:FAD-dependent oxidoreductase [Streptomyces tamarix]MDT9683114.1 FAD-dependent oxidoreductase [Streptomyces tamarix]
MSHDPQADPPPASDLEADFPFDYAAYTAGRRIGRLPDHALGTPVAVVGTGGAGMTAAYELMRVGCRPVLYEAESSQDGPGGRRLGGRMYSRRLHPADSAVVELGCMRFPDSARLLRQYTDAFGLHWRPFRENYASGTTPLTVLHVDGQRHEVRSITDLYPHQELFQQAHTSWTRALTDIGFFDLQRHLAARDRAAARQVWKDLVHRFSSWSFQRFLTEPDGAGLSPYQAQLLGTAGVGPAAWDTFFDLAFLELVRLLLASEGGTMYYLHEGISALAEGFWTHRTTGPDSRTTSLEEINRGAPRPAVTALDVPTTADRPITVHSADGRSESFPAVVFTPQMHALETTVDIRSTGPGSSPFGPRLWRAIRRLSYWPSAKTALVTRDPFWEGTSLDGVTLTDRLPRASYTLDYGEPREDGGRRAVLVLSFTWAEDSMKVATCPLDERVELFLRELSAIHPQVADRLRQEAADAGAETISWENEPHFRGLCRFSRPGEYQYQWDLFAHFMKEFTGEPVIPGEPSHNLFLAGDDIAWSSGWLDHAMASGLNAAWGVLRALGGRTLPDNPGPGDLWTDPAYQPIPSPTSS